MLDLFTQVYSSLLNEGRPTTNKEIAKMIGSNEHRIALLKKHPERATLSEVEALAKAFGCCYRIGAE